MYQLHIANKNYSSWSLRPWVLLKELGIPFEEINHVFADTGNWENFRQFSQTGLVPCLIDGDLSIWDSLAIVEYLAEHHDGVWPVDPKSRAWARCASAEMHSGFVALRHYCSMSCGVRIRLHEVTTSLKKDLTRLEELWQYGLNEFGGPFLAGTSYSAVDAFFAPVVFRLQTYGLDLSPLTTEYKRRALELPAMLQWYEQALNEPYRDNHHEREVSTYGNLIEDFRSPSIE